MMGRKRGRKFIGFVLLILGLFWLLNVAGVLTEDFFRYFWPILVLLIGFFFLLSGGDRRDGPMNTPPPTGPAA